LIAEAPIRAVLFEREGTPHVAYWHTNGEAEVRLSLSQPARLVDESGRPTEAGQREGSSIVVPASHRRFIEAPGATREQVRRAFNPA
jgi:hypothetical protein